MGYMLVIGYCYTCDILFTFNPERVPSIVVDGEREAICRDCVNRANAIRATNGRPPFHVLPDAYEPQEVS